MADSVSQNSFEKLLALLDASDREAAGASYEALRARLVRFFEWRGCETPEELADTVFDRLLKKIGEGEEIQNVTAYAATVARFVFKESRRNPAVFAESIDENPAAAGIAARETAEPDAAGDRRFTCLEKCLGTFDAETRRLLIAYYDTDERTMIATRKRLAESLAVSLNTLRIRVCRLKSRLEGCVRDCCNGSGE
ncbi:MAG: sigma-70 family RNA polymerase sigma factor [Acidobacteria bacterium]|nr:sigma-70 family RNA polymerase sigma factor [Acidobacteriota bacterium]